MGLFNIPTFLTNNVMIVEDFSKFNACRMITTWLLPSTKLAISNDLEVKYKKEESDISGALYAREPSRSILKLNAKRAVEMSLCTIWIH